MQGSVIKVQGKRGTKWAIRYFDQDGARHYETCGSRRVDAEARLAEVTTEVNKGTYRPPKKATLKEFADKWLEAKTADVRPNTLKPYRRHLELRIIPYFGAKRKLQTIQAEDVEAFKAHLASEGVSPATSAKYLLTLSMMCKTAVAWKYVAENPCQFVKRPRGEKTEMQFLEPSELELLISKTDDRFKCLMKVACYSGLRQGELLGLQWQDIDFASSRVFVRRTLQQGELYPPKTEASRRAVVITATVTQALRDHQVQQALADRPTGPEEFVFTTKTGKLIKVCNLVRRTFEPALAAAGLRRVRFHDLRHSYAAALISAGENPKFVQAQLGHSSIKITMDIYGHLSSAVYEDAPARIERAFAAAPDETGLVAELVAETPQNSPKHRSA